MHNKCVIYLDLVLKSFRVYEKGESGPLLLLLHGGGYSALSWAVFTVSDVASCRDGEYVCVSLCCRKLF